MKKKERMEIQKILNGLSPEKKERLKQRLKTHCIHNVAFKAEIPCLVCLKEGGLSDVVKFLLL